MALAALFLGTTVGILAWNRLPTSGPVRDLLARASFSVPTVALALLPREYQIDSERLWRLLQGLPEVAASLPRDFQRFEAFVRGLVSAPKPEGGSPPTQCGHGNSRFGDGWLSLEPPGDEPPTATTTNRCALCRSERNRRRARSAAPTTSRPSSAETGQSEKINIAP